MIVTLFSTLLLLTDGSHAVTNSANDIDSFIKSSEICEIWSGQTDGESSAAEIAATNDSCDPLPQHLAKLRKAHAGDAAGLQRLSVYDTKRGRVWDSSGKEIAPLPKDVVALDDRLDQCNSLAGEFGGDNSDGDREVQRDMEKLNCGDGLAKDLHNLRQHYSRDVRITTRLSMYDDDANSVPLIPAELGAYDAQSGICAEQHGNSADCSQLPARLAKLIVKYRSQSTSYPKHCVWDDQHCYDSATGLPVDISQPSDPKTGKPLPIVMTPRHSSKTGE